MFSPSSLTDSGFYQNGVQCAFDFECGSGRLVLRPCPGPGINSFKDSGPLRKQVWAGGGCGVAAWLWLPQRSWVALAAGSLRAGISQAARGAGPMSSARGASEKRDSVSAVPRGGQSRAGP